MKHVTIYSTPTCHFCKEAKAFFTANNIAYTEYDVATDAVKRAEMIQVSGQLGVPVIVVDTAVMIGFEKGKVAHALGIDA